MTWTAVKPEPWSRKGTTDGHLVLFRFTGTACHCFPIRVLWLLPLLQPSSGMFPELRLCCRCAGWRWYSIVAKFSAFWPLMDVSISSLRLLSKDLSLMRVEHYTYLSELVYKPHGLNQTFFPITSFQTIGIQKVVHRVLSLKVSYTPYLLLYAHVSTSVSLSLSVNNTYVYFIDTTPMF